MKLTTSDWDEINEFNEIKRIIDSKAGDHSGEIQNLEAMIAFDKERVQNQISTSKFELQKTNFYLTWLILVITFSDFVWIHFYLRLIIIILIVIWFLIWILIFKWKSVTWDIDWPQWFQNVNRTKFLSDTHWFIVKSRKQYQSLATERVLYNNILIWIILFICTILIMTKLFPEENLRQWDSVPWKYVDHELKWSKRKSHLKKNVKWRELLRKNDVSVDWTLWWSVSSGQTIWGEIEWEESRTNGLCDTSTK